MSTSVLMRDFIKGSYNATNLQKFKILILVLDEGVLDDLYKRGLAEDISLPI